MVLCTTGRGGRLHRPRYALLSCACGVGLRSQSVYNRHHRRSSLYLRFFCSLRDIVPSPLLSRIPGGVVNTTERRCGCVPRPAGDGVDGDADALDAIDWGSPSSVLGRGPGLRRSFGAAGATPFGGVGGREKTGGRGVRRVADGPAAVGSDNECVWLATLSRRGGVPGGVGRYSRRLGRLGVDTDAARLGAAGSGKTDGNGVTVDGFFFPCVSVQSCSSHHKP